MRAKKRAIVMKFLPSDKYSVAWFKLAECVSRGEKERALGVYRLLSHSFDDPAFACQLEGDILFSFEDEAGALLKYREAIRLYQRADRLLEAAAVCEHVITLVPTKYEYMRLLVDLYARLSMTSKVITYLHMLFALALGNDDAVMARITLEELDQYTQPQETLVERQELVFMYLRNADLEIAPLLPHIEIIVNGAIEVGDQALLQQFLARLEMASQTCFTHVRHYLEKQ